MLDSVVVANLPDGADAYAGYTGGRWPTFAELSRRFSGKAHLLSVAVNAGDDGQCLDIETGDAVPAQAAKWVRRQHGRGVARPVLYASASLMGTVIAAVSGAGIPRSAYRTWSAHYNGTAHICSPQACGFPAVDGTQWRDDAPGTGGSKVDESLLAPDFFGQAAPAPAAGKLLLEERMPLQLPPGQGADHEIALPTAAKSVRFFSISAKIRVDMRSPGNTTELDLSYDSAHAVAVPKDVHAIVVHRLDDGKRAVSVALNG